MIKPNAFPIPPNICYLKQLQNASYFSTLYLYDVSYLNKGI